MRSDLKAGLTATFAARVPGSTAGVWPSRFSAAVASFTLFLIVYLPLENALTGWLTGAPYWVLRLLPDALICVAAAWVVLRDRGTPTRYHALLVGMAAVALAIVALDMARGQGPVDAINATRVVLRYAVLGLVVAICARDLPGFPTLLLVAIVGAGTIQVAIGLLEASTSFVGVGSIPPLAGTTGRYDRFGLFVAALVIAALALLALRPRGWQMALIGFALIVLFWSTSRQAMIAVAVAGLTVALLPRISGIARLTGLGLVGIALLMVVATQAGRVEGGLGSGDGPPPVLVSPAPGASGGPVAAPTEPPRELGSSALSVDPNRNFRLYLNLVLAPWAALVEPIAGLGPARHDSLDADPRLIGRVEEDGIPWSYARPFMNDSNYASLAVQFGLVAPLAYLALLIGTLLACASAVWHRPDPLSVFAVTFGVACLAAAVFGPAFEIRQTSVILWPCLFAVVAWRQRSQRPTPA